MIRLYIIPVVHLTNPNYNVPGYLWHRYNPGLPELENVPWAWTTYLLEDIGIIIADTTDAQDLVLSGQPHVFPVPDLDGTISSVPVRNAIRTTLEDAYIPGTWINVGMVYRNVMRQIAGMIHYHNRAVALSQGRIFAGGIILNTTVGQLTSEQQAAFAQAAQEKGINYSGVGGTTSLRDVLLLANNIYNALNPYEIRGAGLSMVI